MHDMCGVHYIQLTEPSGRRSDVRFSGVKRTSASSMCRPKITNDRYDENGEGAGTSDLSTFTLDFFEFFAAFFAAFFSAFAATFNSFFLPIDRSQVG